jgi:S-DNA-T family DNA segregation ATPase FtsK/SpoIIIE
MSRAREVPDTPGRGLSPAGYHVMVGVPELANQPGGRVDVRGVGAVVRQVAGVEKVSEVLRLPESIALEDVLAQADPRMPREMVPFGLSESTLRPAYVNFAESPHVVAVGRAQSGRTTFLRAMIRSIMTRYTPEEATFILIDPRRRSVGVVPDEWLSRYSYAQGDIRQVVNDLCGVLDQRQPPPTATQQEMLTRKFWSGREFFVVVDDATVWPTADNPLARLAPYVEQADQLGLHIIAAADIRNWSFQASGGSVLGRVVGSLPPVVIFDGRRDNGAIVSGIFAEPQRQGKAIYATASGTDGVLVGFTPAPALPGAQG